MQRIFEKAPQGRFFAVRKQKNRHDGGFPA
jgi:hypothetical protein